jgi:regulator of sigma E protease
METFIKITQFLLSLSILVLLHEFGHFITARMFKTRVEKFYLFFDFLFPFPSVLNFALFKKKIGDTEYGLGWFPLGGYVKIAGMIDESMDEEFLKSEPQPWEFRSKPAWQRLIIMLGGIIVNVLLAWAIYAGMFCYYGEHYLPAENAKAGFACDSTARKIGLQDGDKIISYDGGKKFRDVNTIALDLLINYAKTIDIERGGQKMSVTIPNGIRKEILSTKGAGFVSPIMPCVVDTLLPDYPLAKAGGKQDDRIIKIGDSSINYYHEFKRDIQNFKGTTTTVVVLRGKDTIPLTVAIPDSAIVGFSMFKYDKYFTIVDKEYNILQAIPAGIKKTYEALAGYVKQLRILFDPELKGYKQVGSLITIAQQFAPKWDWLRFWNLTAFLSIALAFANLLPIPALDGGHALFTLYEMITGKAPSDKFLERAQVVGMIIIFSLMFLALGNDILRVFFGSH